VKKSAILWLRALNACGIMPKNGVLGVKSRVFAHIAQGALRNSPFGFLIIGNNCLKQHSFGVRSLFFPVVPVVSKFKPHLRNSPSRFLIMGNNCLKQLSFGARSLFFPVVPVVSNFKPHG